MEKNVWQINWRIKVLSGNFLIFFGLKRNIFVRFSSHIICFQKVKGVWLGGNNGQFNKKSRKTIFIGPKLISNNFGYFIKNDFSLSWYPRVLTVMTHLLYWQCKIPKTSCRYPSIGHQLKGYWSNGDYLFFNFIISKWVKRGKTVKKHISISQ